MHSLLCDFCSSDRRFARGLVGSPHPASFRFHLTMDTLAFGYILPTTGRIRDFHPLETCAARRTKKAPDAACWPCARRFLIGCPLGWPRSACFASGVSCTRPPAHKANRPARRASGYTAYSCSCHSTARCAPLPADHRRGPLQRQTGAEAPCRGMWAALYLFPPSVVRGLSISPALGRRSV